MDIQSQELTEEDLNNFAKSTSFELINRTQNVDPKSTGFKDIEAALSKSLKPVFLVGNGLRLSQHGTGINEIQEFCSRESIPLVSTYLAADFFSNSYPNYLGVAGLKAARRANIALYNSDLVVAIGTRLATSVIGFEYEKFAPDAKIYIIDIDDVEHSKRREDQ